MATLFQTLGFLAAATFPQNNLLCFWQDGFFILLPFCTIQTLLTHNPVRNCWKRRALGLCLLSSRSRYPHIMTGTWSHTRASTIPFFILHLQIETYFIAFYDRYKVVHNLDVGRPAMHIFYYLFNSTMTKMWIKVFSGV